jgi:hypothetical protein
VNERDEGRVCEADRLAEKPQEGRPAERESSNPILGGMLRKLMLGSLGSLALTLFVFAPTALARQLVVASYRARRIFRPD